VRPSQAVRDMQGRVNLDNLTEGDLDYGAERRGLARLRRRLTCIVYKFNGTPPPPTPHPPQPTVHYLGCDFHAPLLFPMIPLLSPLGKC